MLVLGGHNALGNVLHVIVGPESDFYQDINGCATLDITPVLAAMNGTEKCYISLTRCRSEQGTSHAMAAGKLSFLNSLAAPVAERDKPTVDTPETTAGTCQYCGRHASLLPIEGFKVCSDCAAIELGRRCKRK